jgi:hypothetical protein
MASNKTGQKSRKADPMRTKNGNPRLGPLNVPQLEKLLTSTRKKNQAKITRRIAVLKGRSNYRAPAVAEAVAE